MHDPSSPVDNFFSYFAVIWIALSLIGFLLFYFGKNVAFKRKWFPRYVILGAVLFAGILLEILWKTDGALPIPAAFMLPFIGLITYLNIRLTKFCEGCGKIIFRRRVIREKFCPFCGTPLPK